MYFYVFTRGSIFIFQKYPRLDHLRSIFSPLFTWGTQYCPQRNRYTRARTYTYVCTSTYANSSIIRGRLRLDFGDRKSWRWLLCEYVPAKSNQFRNACVLTLTDRPTQIARCRFIRVPAPQVVWKPQGNPSYWHSRNVGRIVQRWLLQWHSNTPPINRDISATCY